MRIEFSIPLSPITKKNHQEIVKNPKTGKPFVIPSRQYKEYEKSAMWFIPKPQKPIGEPVNVRCLFFLPTRRKGDLTNYLEAIDDVMVKCGLLEDDNYTVIQSHDGSRVLYDKENPRTEIVITSVEEVT